MNLCWLSRVDDDITDWEGHENVSLWFRADVNICWSVITSEGFIWVEDTTAKSRVNNAASGTWTLKEERMGVLVLMNGKRRSHTDCFQTFSILISHRQTHRYYYLCVQPTVKKRPVAMRTQSPPLFTQCCLTCCTVTTGALREWMTASTREGRGRVPSTERRANSNCTDLDSEWKRQRGKKRTNRDLNPESDATTHEHFYSIWTGAKEVLYKYVGVCPCVDISCRVRLCTYVLSLRARCERVRMCECLNGFSRGLQYQCHMWEVLSLLYWPWHAGSLAMQHGSQQHLLHHKHTCSAVKLWKQPA